MHVITHTGIISMYDYFYFSPAHDEINIEIARPPSLREKQA